MADGRLFYLVGPSGCGKDSLIRYARTQLSAEPRVVFAHRYITRAVEVQGENHIALSEAEFDSRLAAGLFIMAWHSHGLRYGIGQEILLWLEQGCNVVVNGSREYLPQASKRFPDLVVIMVSVSPQVLAARLHQRGRESEYQIAKRLQRAALFNQHEIPMEVIWNDRKLPEAGNQLIKLLTDHIDHEIRI